MKLHGGRLDLERGVFAKAEEELRLTANEIALLRYLVERPGQAVSYDEPNTEALGQAATVVSRAAYYGLRRLRQKIERDPTAPDHLVAVVGEGVKFVPLSERPQAPPRDRFVGRERLLEELPPLLGAAPLVTLVGPGGVGKTRLAEELARRLDRDVVTVPLAEVTTAGGLLAAIAGALGLPDLAEDGAAEALGVVVAERGHVLVLDNLEQLAPVAAVLAPLVARAGGSLLATSREPLGLRGERTVAVEPLSAEDARELFRARALDAGVSLPESEDLADLLATLDHLPLALELAAARTSVLPLDELRARLADRFAVLRSRRRDLPARHATLEATIAWSWELLEPWERSALAQLTVTRGGFDLRTAEAVVELRPQAPPVLDVVHDLADRSLLRRTGPGRWVLYESVRAWAERHGLPFVVDRAGDRLATFAEGLGDPSRLADLRTGRLSPHAAKADLGNLLAGLEQALARGRGDAAARAASAACVVVSYVGPYALVLDVARRVLAVEMSDLRRLQLLRAFARCLVHASCFDEALASYGRAVVLAEELGDRLTEGKLRVLRASVLAEQLRLDEAEEDYGIGVARLEAHGDARSHASALAGLAALHIYRGRHALAVPEQRRAFGLLEAGGSPVAATITLGNLGIGLVGAGLLEEGRARLVEAARRQEQAGNVAAVAIVALHLADLEVLTGDLDAALAAAEQARSEGAAAGNRQLVSCAGIRRGRALLELGRHEEARDQLRASLDQLHAPDLPHDAAEAWLALARTRRELGVPLAEVRSDVEHARELVGEGPDVTFRLRVRLADAQLALAAGRRDDARATAHEVAQRMAELDLTPRSFLGQELKALEEAIHGAG